MATKKGGGVMHCNIPKLDSTFAKINYIFKNGEFNTEVTSGMKKTANYGSVTIVNGLLRLTVDDNPSHTNQNITTFQFNEIIKIPENGMLVIEWSAKNHYTGLSHKLTINKKITDTITAPDTTFHKSIFLFEKGCNELFDVTVSNEYGGGSHIDIKSIYLCKGSVGNKLPIFPKGYVLKTGSIVVVDGTVNNYTQKFTLPKENNGKSIIPIGLELKASGTENRSNYSAQCSIILVTPKVLTLLNAGASQSGNCSAQAYYVSLADTFGWDFEQMTGDIVLQTRLSPQTTGQATIKVISWLEKKIEREKIKNE